MMSVVEWVCELRSNRADEYTSSDPTDPHSPFDVHFCGRDELTYCHNGGSCYRSGPRGARVYICDCARGWYGPTCEICKYTCNNARKNTARHSASALAVMCMCMLVSAEPCHEDACFEHGTCHINDDFTANCTCADTYAGSDCSAQWCADAEITCYNGGHCP